MVLDQGVLKLTVRPLADGQVGLREQNPLLHS